MSVCRMTGRRFVYTSKGRRPREYVSEDAKQLAHILSQLGPLLGKLPEMTHGARQEMRAQLRTLTNRAELSLSKKTYPTGVLKYEN